jgi:plastocyanin
MPRDPFRLARIGAFALLMAIPLACAGPTSPAPTNPPMSSAPGASDAPAAGSMTIAIKDFKFDPASQTVAKGATVTWTNREDSLHTVTAGTPESPSGLFDSGEIDTGVEFGFTFDTPGTYPFFCARHDFMQGEITVTP